MADGYPHLLADKDRYGKVRHYVRIRGRQKRRVHAEPGSAEFDAEYAQALAAAKENDPFTLPPRKRGAYSSELENFAGRLLVSARKRATERGIPWSLPTGYALNVLRQQDHKCCLSGLRFAIKRADDQRGGRLPFAPSLDRIDCAKGYEPGNVRWVLQAVNIALADWGEAQLVMIAQAIAAKHAS